MCSSKKRAIQVTLVNIGYRTLLSRKSVSNCVDARQVKIATTRRLFLQKVKVKDEVKGPKERRGQMCRECG